MEEQQKKPSGSKISNTEWGLVIGALVIVDLVQFGLDSLLVGVFVNWLIDIAVGMALPFYFYLRGVKMDWKKGGALGLTFLLETLGIGWLDSLPLWSLDGVVTMVLDKGDRILKKVVPMVDKIEKFDKLGTKIRDKFKKAP